jgi:hypothetical protein
MDGRKTRKRDRHGRYLKRPGVSGSNPSSILKQVPWDGVTDAKLDRLTKLEALGRKRIAALTAEMAQPVVMGGSPFLSVGEVCDIIKECHSANVSSFTFKGLSITFGEIAPRPILNGKLPEPHESDLMLARSRAAELKVAQEEAETMERIEGQDFELEQLKLNDPAEWERRIMNGEVEG